VSISIRSGNHNETGEKRKKESTKRKYYAKRNEESQKVRPSPVDRKISKKIRWGDINRSFGPATGEKL